MQAILSVGKKYGIPENKLIIHSASYLEVPTALMLSSVSIFFIKPVFSKKASSPTKLAETLSMGIPVICNSGIGDMDNMMEEGKSCLIVPEFNHEEYDNAILQIENLIDIPPDQIRFFAEKTFSLDIGVAKYNHVYSRLLGLDLSSC